MDLYSELEWRGLVYDASEGVQEVLAREKVTAYIGFDPTASSLHVGSLLPILALARLRHFGHSVVALVGGGTGLIGDPSGKVGERSLLDHEQVKANAVAVKKQLGKILASASRRAKRQGRTADSLLGAKKIVDNAKWLKKLTAVEFMRDVGKHFTDGRWLMRDGKVLTIDEDDVVRRAEQTGHAVWRRLLKQYPNVPFPIALPPEPN